MIGDSTSFARMSGRGVAPTRHLHRLIGTLTMLLVRGRWRLFVKLAFAQRLVRELLAWCMAVREPEA